MLHSPTLVQLSGTCRSPFCFQISYSYLNVINIVSLNFIVGEICTVFKKY